MIRIGWFWWVLATVPALAGVLSLAVFGTGNFRSSGLVAGISVSLGLLAVLLLWRRPWRGRRGASRWLSVVPGLVLGLVALAGLNEGLPEFLEARGLFVDVDAVGPTAVVWFDDGYVVVGNDSNGGSVWFSADGTNWLRADDPVLDGLQLWDMIAVEGGLVVLGQAADPSDAVILSSSDGLVWVEAGRFGNKEYGTAAEAISQMESALIVISDIYGNDVEFYRSADMSSWVIGHPAPVFDDGEGGSDIACNDRLCIAVGSHDATYRPDLESNTGVAWVSTTGDRYDLVSHDFQTEQVQAVAVAAAGFVAIGNNPDGHGVAWLSKDGHNWSEIAGPFNEMMVDGIVSTDTGYTIFGRDPVAGKIIVWTSADTRRWDREILPGEFPEASQVRSISHNQDTRIAAGIASDTLHTIIWISTGGQPWQHIATLETAQPNQ